MERKSGFKECPRCGLRNKPSAPQCDFCGWEFKDASDEWISHVQVLEKMSREAEPIVIDEEVSKRIESTIMRDRGESPQVIAIKQAAAPEAETPLPSREENANIEIHARTLPSAPLISAPMEEEQIKAFTETMVGPPEELFATAPDPVFAQSASRTESPLVMKREQINLVQSRWMLPLVLLFAGALIYVVSLLALGSAFLSTAIGWALAITGALLMTTGANFLYEMRLASKSVATSPAAFDIRGDEEVFICPRCHERVHKADARCPGCGARFRKAV
jgi:hypothetical protein